MSRKIRLVCVGKTKSNAPEQALYEKYRARCRFFLDLVQIPEARAETIDAVLAAEAQAMAARIPAQAFVICLDERGQDLTSPELARILQTAFDTGRPPTFLIGGAKGLAPNLRAKADMCLRFGRLVWPHLLIRALLMEQIYRAQTILDGHPYHR